MTAHQYGISWHKHQHLLCGWGCDTITHTRPTEAVDVHLISCPCYACLFSGGRTCKMQITLFTTQHPNHAHPSQSWPFTQSCSWLEMSSQTLALAKQPHPWFVTKVCRGNHPPKWPKSLLCPQCAPCQINFPCTICHKAVTWEAKAPQCDGCDCWTQLGCTLIGENTYNDLQDSSKLWLCLGCGIPNNTDLINTYNVSVSNSFDMVKYNLRQTSTPLWTLAWFYWTSVTVHIWKTGTTIKKVFMGTEFVLIKDIATPRHVRAIKFAYT